MAALIADTNESELPLALGGGSATGVPARTERLVSLQHPQAAPDGEGAAKRSTPPKSKTLPLLGHEIGHQLNCIHKPVI